MVKSLFVKRDFSVFNQDWIYLTMRIRVDGYLKLLRALSKKRNVVLDPELKLG